MHKNGQRLIFIHPENFLEPVLDLEYIGDTDLVGESFIGEPLQPSDTREAGPVERGKLIGHIAW